MGAAFSVTSIREAAVQGHYGAFTAAVERREASAPGAAHDAAQAEVEALWDAMHPHEGYFWEPFTPASLLLVVGMSFNRDVMPLLDDEQNMSPAHARGLAGELAQRAEVLEHKIAQRAYPFDDEDDREGVAQWQRERLVQFVALLRGAADRGEPVYCSY